MCASFVIISRLSLEILCLNSVFMLVHFDSHCVESFSVDPVGVALGDKRVVVD